MLRKCIWTLNSFLLHAGMIFTTLSVEGTRETLQVEGVFVSGLGLLTGQTPAGLQFLPIYTKVVLQHCPHGDSSP